LPNRSKANSPRLPRASPSYWHVTEPIEKAAGLWSKTGQQSRARSALVEAITQLTNALSLITNLPSTPAINIGYLAFNTEKKPFSDKHAGNDEAYASLGLVRRFQGRLHDAVAASEQALAINKLRFPTAWKRSRVSCAHKKIPGDGLVTAGKKQVQSRLGLKLNHDGSQRIEAGSPEQRRTVRRDCRGTAAR
jgi:hypothetical protein